MLSGQNGISRSHNHLDVDLIPLLNSYIDELKKSRLEMRYPYELFSSEPHIWPDQYKCAFFIIYDLCQSLNSIAVLTRDFSNFPVALRSKRYTLLFALDRSLSFAKNILANMNETSYSGHSTISDKLKAIILTDMEHLMVEVDDVNNEVRRLLHKWKFLKQSNVVIIETK